MIEFGKRLKEARVKKGLNQEELAEKMGLKQASISQFENGLRLPTPANIQKLAEILGVPVEALAGEDQGEFEKSLLMRNLDGLSAESIQKINEYTELIKLREREKKKE